MSERLSHRLMRIMIKERRFQSLDHIAAWISVVSVIVLFLAAIVIRLRRRRRYDLQKITLHDIDRMTGLEFEHYLYVFFSVFWEGETFLTKKSGDYGADLLLVDEHGERTVVQAKRLTDHLSVSAVQEVYTAKAYYHASRALIITSTDAISEPCRKLAAATQVRIVARSEFAEMIRLFKRAKFDEIQQLLDEPYEHVDYNPLTSVETIKRERGIIRAGEFYYKV